MADIKTQTTVEAELRAAAEKLRAEPDRPFDALAAELLDHIALDIEHACGEERDFPDYIQRYQRMVADARGEDRMDWTAALAFAQAVNGSGS